MSGVQGATGAYPGVVRGFPPDARRAPVPEQQPTPDRSGCHGLTGCLVELMMDTNANTDSNATTQVAIVGGGLAGLVASIAAAQAGARVLLIERGQLGGRARSTRSQNGFCLNRGPHALYVGHALDRALHSFGITPRGATPSQRRARGLLTGRLGRLPVGPGSLLATDLIPARAKPQLARQFLTIPRLDPSEYRDQTVREWIEGLGAPPSVQRLLYALVRLTTYGADADIGSADVAIGQVQSGMSSGVQYLDNGWQQLVDALRCTAIDHGVTLRTGCRVRQVERTSVRLDDGTTMEANSVVVAGLGPTAVAALVAGCPDLSDAAGPPVEAAALDVGLSGDGLGGDAASGFVLGLDEPLYLNRHSPPANLAPSGRALYSALRYLRRGEAHDHQAAADRLLRLAHQAGLSADSIVETRYLHRLRVAHGQPVAERGGLAGRPGVLAAEVPGVFLAGDWIGPHGLLADASAASARSAAELAVAHSRARECVG